MCYINRPDWLSPEVVLSGNSIEEDIRVLYEYFRGTFIDTPLIFEGRRVIFDNNISKDFLSYGEYPSGFAHIITKENGGNGFRGIDYERAKKIPWIRDVIENYKDEKIRYFIDPDHKGSGLPRFYFWLFEYNFIVILSNLKSKAEFNKNVILVTAYSVEQYGYRRLEKLHRRYSDVILNIEQREHSLSDVLIENNQRTAP